MRTMIAEIASLLLAIRNCERNGNDAWTTRHKERLADLIAELPSGSGWDNGTTLDDDSTPDRVIFYGSYHHMNDGGMYDGWTDHRIIVTPSLAFGFDIRVTGRNRNDIKSYLGEMFSEALGREVPQAAAESVR